LVIEHATGHAGQNTKNEAVCTTGPTHVTDFLTCRERKEGRKKERKNKTKHIHITIQELICIAI
jgi:hypothetical protein